VAGLLTCSGGGYGDGDGGGYGGGYGDGDGDGDGSGYGSGYGDGDGDPIGEIAGFAAAVNAQWGVVKIGCQVHTVAGWRAEWRQAADDEGVDVADGDIEALLAKAEAAIMSASQ